MTDAPQTLREFQIMVTGMPGGNAWLNRCGVRTPEEYVRRLMEDLDAVFRDMESNPQFHYEEGEDRITYHVATMLKQKGYRTAQGQFNGGSVDLTVEGLLEGHKWTGEAKIFRALDNLNEGWLQLETRYRPADYEHAYAGMLIYIQRSNPAALVADWRAFLKAKGLPNFNDSACASRPHLAFYSVHQPKFSGISMQVRHMGLAINHKPEDKSARNSKKYGSTNP